VELVERLRNIDGIEKLGITTNALVLERKLPRLIQAGVTQFNISLDTLVSAKFNFITRRRGFSRVLSAIQATEEAYQDASVVKVNCVVMRGMNEDEIVDFVDMTKDRKITVRFIEYMPFDSNKWNTKKLVPFTEMLSEIRSVHSNLERIGDTPCATQKTYRVPNFLGQIGFVTSMTNHFCGGCNRLRLTADGNLKVRHCLNREHARETKKTPSRRLSYYFFFLSYSQFHVLTTTTTTTGMSFWRGGDQLERSDSSRSERRGYRTHDRGCFESKTCSTRRTRRYTQTRPRKQSSDDFNRRLRTEPFKMFARHVHGLSHISEDGTRPNMVDVGNKRTSRRTAWARAEIELPGDVMNALHSGGNELMTKKGPVFATATIAGVMAAKKTSDLIPFCHPLPLENCDIDIQMDDSTVLVDCRVSVHHKTGVEMEALTGASAAALCVYDMCKALSHDISIRNVRLMEKSGGKRDFSRSDG